MTPRERFLNALRGKPVDRVPLDLPGFDFPSREALESQPDPRRREIGEAIYRDLPFFVQTPSYINRYLVTPPQRMKGEIEHLPDGHRRTNGIIDTPKGKLTYATQYDPKSRTSWAVKYPVENLEDIKKIASVPWERPEKLAPVNGGLLPNDFPERGVHQVRISSPFVCVAGMMSYEYFLELTATHPGLIAELTEICRERILDALTVLLSKLGIDQVWIGGSEWVTPPMTSTDVYDALVQEQERSLIDYIHENSSALVHVHCHGHVRHALPRTIERGGDYTEPVEPPPDGDITLSEAKQIANGRIALGGNIECRILCNETENTVEQAVRTAFEGGKERFVLRPTEGPTPQMSDRETRNYKRLIDVWNDLSPMSY